MNVTLQNGCSDETIDLGDCAALPVGPSGKESLAMDTLPTASAAVAAALAEPVGLPPLVQCLTEDDHVAVAVGEGVAELAEVTATLLDAMCAANISSRQVTLVAVDKLDFDLLTESFTDQIAEGMQVVLHDPDCEEQLCFAGVDRKDQPINLNRSLFEADVILPLLAAKADAHHGACGAFGDLFPAFSDTAAIKQFHSNHQEDSPVTKQHLIDVADQAGWTIGAPMALYVVAGAAGRVAKVFAGETQEANRQASAFCQQFWSRTAAGRASLVIATLSGDPQRQTWSDLARALAAVEPLVEDHGAVALCTGLAQTPSPALQSLAAADDLEADLMRLGNDNTTDAWATAQIANAMLRGPVYLMSQLDAELIESLGMAPLSGSGELRRLANRHSSCLVLEDADRVIVEIPSD